VAEPGGPHGPGPPLLNLEFRVYKFSNTNSIGSVVELNCLMKKILQRFGSIFSMFFVIYYL